MTNKTVTVKSVIENLDDYGIPEAEAERTEIKVPAEVFSKNGATVIRYTEKNEGGTTDTELVVKGLDITLTRRGAIESVMHFAEGELYETLYKIPPFSFDAKIKTKRIRSTLSDTAGTLELRYNMTVGGASKNALLKITVD